MAAVVRVVVIFLAVSFVVSGLGVLGDGGVKSMGEKSMAIGGGGSGGGGNVGLPVRMLPWLRAVGPARGRSAAGNCTPPRTRRCGSMYRRLVADRAGKVRRVPGVIIAARGGGI